MDPLARNVLKGDTEDVKKPRQKTAVERNEDPAARERETAVVEEDTGPVDADSLFGAVKDYLGSHMKEALADIELLSDLNKLAADKYAGMTKHCDQLEPHAEEMRQNYEELKPHLEQIGRLGGALDTLESTVDALDHYTKALAQKLKGVKHSG